MAVFQNLRDQHGTKLVQPFMSLIRAGDVPVRFDDTRRGVGRCLDLHNQVVKERYDNGL